MARKMMPPSKKDIVLFVVNVPEGVVGALKELKKMYGYKVLSAAIYDPKKPSEVELVQQSHVDILIPVDFSSPSKITKALLPYQDRLLAITCRGEYNIGHFRELIPHVPYLRTPTATSLEWATNKLEMRKRFLRTMHPLRLNSPLLRTREKLLSRKSPSAWASRSL